MERKGEGERTGNLLRSRAAEVVRLTLVGCTATVPEKEPLQCIIALELVLEAEDVVLVELLEEVEQLGAGLHDGEGRVLGVVDEDGDAAVGVQAEEPFVLLDVGGDVAAEAGSASFWE